MRGSTSWFDAADQALAPLTSTTHAWQERSVIADIDAYNMAGLHTTVMHHSVAHLECVTTWTNLQKTWITVLLQKMLSSAYVTLRVE